MSKVSEVAAYFCEHYPHKTELSKTRLTKLVYLADWKSAQKYRKQITDIEWFFNHYGPFVDDVYNSVQEDRARFSLHEAKNFYGDAKLIIGLSDNGRKPSLNESEKKVLDEVIEETRGLYWKSFINHVYSTPPIANSNRYKRLNLNEYID